MNLMSASLPAHQQTLKKLLETDPLLAERV